MSGQTILSEGGAGAQPRVASIPRAIIPPLEPFELTPPPERPPSREDFLIAAFERRFGGRAVRLQPKKEFPEFGEPDECVRPRPEAPWKKHVLLKPVEDGDGEPILGDGGGENQAQAREMYRLGLKLKAQRLACCSRFGRRLECIGERHHSFFEPFNCGCRTCQRCAPLLARKLFERLMVLEVVVKKRPGWTLALLDFTLKNTGSLPNAELIRAANVSVKHTMRLLLRGVDGWGYLWIDEFGFDNSNLHMHGIYYGPYLKQKRISHVWCQQTGGSCAGEETAACECCGKGHKESKGSYVTYIQKVRRSFRAALWHHLGYVSKPPSNDPCRLAEIESAFHGVRKVHTLGAFYAPEIGDVSEEEVDRGPAQRCPYCGEFLILASGFCPVSELESSGLINVNVVRRVEFLKRMGTGPP